MQHLDWREPFRLYNVSQGRAASTTRAYLYDVARYRRWCSAHDIDPDTASRVHVLMFIEDYQRTNTQSAAVRRFAALRTYYAWLRSEGRPDDPTEGIRLRHPETPIQEPFSEDDLRLILRACRRIQDRSLIQLLIDTGLRLSELTALRLRDVNWAHGTIRIRGKGDKVRLLALGNDALAALRLSMDGRDYPWYSQRIHGPMTPDGVYRLMRRLSARTGLHIHPHRFRTTFACRFLEQSGNDVEALQLLMGHAKLETTLHYTRWGRTERALAQQRRVALGDRL